LIQAVARIAYIIVNMQLKHLGFYSSAHYFYPIALRCIASADPDKTAHHSGDTSKLPLYNRPAFIFQHFSRVFCKLDFKSWIKSHFPILKSNANFFQNPGRLIAYFN
jgi:hypothetical protein